MRRRITGSVFSRRQFISKAFLGSLGAWCQALPFLGGMLQRKAWAQTSAGIVEADCIVLGAGMAGITAARHLSDRMKDIGFKVIVLEGSNRIGGRVHSIRNVFPGPSPIEMGAESVHIDWGVAPIWDEIDRYNVPMRTVPRMCYDKFFYAGWKRRKIKSSIETALSWDLFRALGLFNEIEKGGKSDISAEEFMRAGDYAGVGHGFIESVLGHQPAPFSDLSLKGFCSDRLPAQLSGWNEHAALSGMDSIIGRMADGLDIRFLQTVQRVAYGPEGVEVRTQDKVYRAKAAVCSFSIGMLKSGQVEFFPELPAGKKDALSKLDGGFHSKMAIQFTEAFWPEGMANLHRLDSKRRGAKHYFHAFYGEEDAPAILNALFMGDEAKKVRSLADEELLRLICADLDEMFPRAASLYEKIARRADGSLVYSRKEWMDDPFARGGNAYLNMNREGILDITEVRRSLQDPSTTPGLFWAGEAVALDSQPASVHGAHVSGLRATDDVMKHLNL